VTYAEVAESNCFMRCGVQQVGGADGDCGVLAKEKDYEEQSDGSGGIGCRLCCGDGCGDGAGWGDRCRGREDAGGEDPGAASYRAEGHEPDRDGRGHCFAAARYTRNETAGDGPEHGAVGWRSRKVLAHLQTLRGRLA